MQEGLTQQALRGCWMRHCTSAPKRFIEWRKRRPWYKTSIPGRSFQFTGAVDNTATADSDDVSPEDRSPFEEIDIELLMVRVLRDPALSRRIPDDEIGISTY